MHRVELKASRTTRMRRPVSHVPNAPCGVERYTLSRGLYPTSSFLMHRVELKVLILTPHHASHRIVPNAPCGVESFKDYKDAPSCVACS